MVLTAKDFIAKKEREFNKERDKDIFIKDTGGEKCCFVRESWVFMAKRDEAGRVFSIEKLRTSGKEKKEETVYRVGYFIAGDEKVSNLEVYPENGKFIFEGYCPLMTRDELKTLRIEGTKKGVLSPTMLRPGSI